MINYPPYIEGKLPSFYKENKALEIKIPFTMNPAVARGSVSGMALKIKSIYDSSFVLTFKATVTNNDIDFNNSIVTFKVTDTTQINQLIIGTAYKAQLAYIDTINEKDEVGIYSTVGIIKYTNKPSVTISDLLPNNETNFLVSNKLIGQYYNSQDINEKPYSYQFIIYADNKETVVYEQSEVLIHNNETSIELGRYEDTYIIKKSLETGKQYYVKYIVTTTSGLVVESMLYPIQGQIYCISQQLKNLKLITEMNKEEGYIKLQLAALVNPDSKLRGQFLLTRTDSTTNYLEWHTIANFNFYGDDIKEINFKDFDIQSGVSYKYGLQQYNTNDIYSFKIYSEPIIGEFDYIYLYDGKRQLKIKFNPQVSSFKTTLQEAKINTLGGKFPMFFKNGFTAYKEFPISGLISYWMDEDENFMSKEELGLIQDNYPTTNLLDYNIEAEKRFKLKVLEFLDNGKPKLYKSATEGNYIVRLMTSQLTPNTVLGNMLHTFSTTATEIADYNYNNLSDLQIITNEVIDNVKRKVETINLLNYNTEINSQGISLESYKNSIVKFVCQGMYPGTALRIQYTDNTDDHSEVSIGITGSYELEFDSPIYNLKIAPPDKISNLVGQINIIYVDSSTKDDIFDNYESITPSTDQGLKVVGPEGGKIDFQKKEDEEEDNINICVTFLRFTTNNKEHKTFTIDGDNFTITQAKEYKINHNIEDFFLPEITWEDGITVEYYLQKIEINTEGGKNGE